MTGKGHLAIRGEDAHVRGVAGIGDWQDERSLDVIEFGGKCLHLRHCQPLGVEHDRDGVAAQRLRGEHVGSRVATLHQTLILPTQYMTKRSCAVSGPMPQWSTFEPRCYPLERRSAISWEINAATESQLLRNSN